MKIERIKKNHKKEIIVGGLILVSIVSAITLVTTRAKYKVTQDLKLAKGTVNYKPYDFKIMAMYQSEDGTNYTEVNEMPTSGYVVNEEKSYCTTDNAAQVKGKIKTINGNHVISNLEKSDKCYVWFDKKQLTASETILDNVTVKTGTPNFAQVATTNEGVFKISDGMYGGTSYYFRGAVTNNYVKFANKCWRIIRINGDGSIRLIYDGTTCHANGTETTDSIAMANQVYNEKSSSFYVGWTYTVNLQRPENNATGSASNIKTQTETWYNSNIGNNTTYNSKIADGKFCNDRNVASGYTWTSSSSGQFNYAGKERFDNHAPTLSCDSKDVYTLKVGAITADEVVYAGGSNTVNTSYYLYNGNNYWTMTPMLRYNGGGTSAFMVYSSSISGSTINSESNLRPIINIKSDITFSSGNGTQSNPYVVS